MTGIQVANWKLGVHGDTGDASASDSIDTTLSILEAMDPMDLSVWTGVELDWRNKSKREDADKIYRRMKDRETVRGLRRKLGKRLDRNLFGYGTNLMPALGLALLLALALFGVLAQDQNVKLADGSLLQLANQCSRLGTVSDAAVPTKCAVLGNAAAGTPEPTLELTARRLDSEGVPSGYGWSDAALLTLRYAIPFVGALGDPEWMPVEQTGVVVGEWHVPVPPSAIAAIVLLVNSILLSLVAAFFTRRLLR
jgi:hypothetical protein